MDDYKVSIIFKDGKVLDSILSNVSVSKQKNRS